MVVLENGDSEFIVALFYIFLFIMMENGGSELIVALFYIFIYIYFSNIMATNKFF